MREFIDLQSTGVSLLRSPPGAQEGLVAMDLASGDNRQGWLGVDIAIGL